MMVKLQNQIADSKRYGLGYEVVDMDWVQILVVESALEGKVKTYFYITGSECTIDKEKIVRRYYSDKKGTYFKFKSKKVYFNF